MCMKLLTIVGLCFGFILFLCDLPSPPPGPEKASVELGFELPNGEQVKANYTDSLGLKTKICMNLHLTQYIDSIVLIISNDVNFADTFSFNSYPSTGSDAIVKQSIVLPAVGKYTVVLTGYVDGQQPRVVTASINIVGRIPIVPNQKPTLQVPVLQKVGVGQMVIFKVSATDPDTNQKLSISVHKKPETATFQADSFKWAPAMADTGLDTAIFHVWDNGTPALSDTDTVYIVISPNPVNRAPVWVSRKVRESVQVGEVFLYDLSNGCYDLDGEKLTFYLRAELPVNDTIKGNTYTFAPTTSDTGKHIVHISVRDTSGLEDTLTLELTVTGNTGADTKPPIFTRVKPENDSATIHSSSYAVSVVCRDGQSGVDSVKCFMGTTLFSVTKTGDSLYSATVNGLIAGWNTIAFAARDASPAKNPCTLLVHLNYVKDAIDKTPPVIKFQSPSKDTAISADSFEVKVTCEDDSGCSVKGYRDGTSITLKKSASVANLWTGMAKGIAAGSYSIIKIVATDSSAAKNKDSLTVKIKYDNDKSGPMITFVQPATKSTATNSSIFSIELKCLDVSGVSSVKGTLTTSIVPGVRSGENWIVTMNNLVLGNNTIIITAIDSSLRANSTTDTINVKYDPTMEDTVAPIIRQIGVPISGSIVSNAVVEITDSISDPSGIDSVYWVHNGTKKMMTPVTGKVDLYSLKDTLREGVLDSLVITAYDKTTRKNFRRQVITLTYVNPPLITKQPVSQSVCALSQAIFSVNATGSGPLTYQWRTGTAAPFTNVGTNSPICTLTATSASILSCVVSNQAATNATSNLCTLTVNMPAGTPTGKATPDTVLLGDSKTVTLSVTAGNPGTGGSWVWYASDKATKVAANPFTPAATSTYYVRSENGACGVGAWSSAVQVTVNQPAGTPTGKATPASVCFGDLQAVTLSIVAGDPGTGGSWVWYASDKVTKVTANPFTPSSTGISTYFVRSEGGVSGAGTWSAGIQVTVNQPAGVPTGTATPPSVCLGSTQQVTLSATGTTGTGGSWVWYEADQTTKVATNPFTPTASKSYYARSEGSACGVGPWSAAVAVTVNPAVTITGPSNPPASCTGSASVSVTAAGGTGFTYQWRLGTPPNGTIITGASSASHTVSASGSYYCVVTNNTGCSATSAAASVTINPSITISQQPSATTNTCPGVNATISVTSQGGTSYQWYVGTAPNGTTVTGTGFSGMTGPALTLPGTSAAQGSYYCVISNTNGCSVTSSASAFSLNSSVTVAVSPAAPLTCPGVAVTLTAAPTGGSSHQFKWFRGTPSGTHTEITGATSATYSASAGTYYCVATSSSGCIGTSNTSTVTERTITASTPATGIDVQYTTWCAGNKPPFGVVGGSLGTDAVWKWYYDAACTQPATYTPIYNDYSRVNLTIPNLTSEGIVSVTVRAEVNGGTCTVAPSAARSVAITVKTQSTNPTSVTASPSVTVAPGTSVTLTVNGGTLGSNASWIWREGGVEVGTGRSIIVNPEYTTVYTVEGQGYCDATSSLGRTVTTSLQITQQPVTVIWDCNSQSRGVFTVLVRGGSGNYSYQWYGNFDGTNNGSALTDDQVYGFVRGSATSQLTLIPQDQRWVWCVITDNVTGSTTTTNHVVYDLSQCP